jgi:hypothetical protein
VRGGSDLFNFSDVFASMWGDADTGGAGEVVTVELRDAGSTDGQTGDAVEVFGQAPLLYRPAAPTKDGTCQVLTLEVGGRKIAIGSRDPRATQASGALNEGDVAVVCPTAKNALRLNADNSISLLQQGEEADAFLRFETDGTFLAGNRWGQIELGANGFHVHLVSGEVLSIGDGQAILQATAGILNCGSIRLGTTAAVPLCSVPTVPPGGFACPKATPNIFV